MTPDAHGKPQIFECANCWQIVGIDNIKKLVIPVITAGATGMRVQMKLRGLCPECYDDFYYFLTEDWDAQKGVKVRGPPDPAPSDPPPNQRLPPPRDAFEKLADADFEGLYRRSGPSKPAATKDEPLTGGAGANPVSERGQPGAGGAPFGKVSKADLPVVMPPPAEPPSEVDE